MQAFSVLRKYLLADVLLAGMAQSTTISAHALLDAAVALFVLLTLLALHGLD